MFDKVEAAVRAGDGGAGKVSFRREKFVPFGGPDGGDGGKGGDVIVTADSSVSDLRMFQHKRLYRAGNGGHGENKQKHGKNGEDRMIAVPEGTTVWQKTPAGGHAFLADLQKSGQRVVVAKGGKGGLGNIHFASSIHQAPHVAQSGEPGEENEIILELRLIADAGIVGYPNAGKSTLLAQATAARPEIASYPFTTREPVLGVVEVGRRRFVLAEIPGLIDGAHLGRGLGHDFLRHATRTRVLIHLIDGTSESPVENMIKVNTELALFDVSLARRPQIVAVNKIDLPEVRARLDEIKQAFGAAGVTAWFISGATGEGVPELMVATEKLLRSTASPRVEEAKDLPLKVFRPRPVDSAPRVRKEGDIFIVASPELERLVATPDASSRPALLRQLKQDLARLGIDRALARAGIKTGDKVRCGNLEWEWNHEDRGDGGDL